ncbi:MAG: aminotransferase class I/II-fold pyridoxal phosphate-dependent enzyme [Methylacidiphilales bacterium]|nr:aminotransferase class I/II-fold pyridoxal phosphate-dependent enzyme [Candidatus Methylacidiphilales bacterium]MDW8348822.1 aminotransferase class I/II-fold pyridoxal phosphate-dependent enzyme [Verrucomicrobiae bacterium]
MSQSSRAPFSPPIAKHVLNIPRSGIRDFFEIVQSMQDVISLGIGEPDFSSPEHIRQAAIDGLRAGRTGYTSNLGIPRLRKAISQYLAQYYHVYYDPSSEIIVTAGVSEALDLALRAIIDPGDEIIYHEPCYVSYSPSIRLCHGIPVPVQTHPENCFALKASQLEPHITPRTKAILLNFPTNPTGAAMPQEELKKIAALAQNKNLLVITDEIYSELTYEGQHTSIASLPGMKERTIFLHGFSKAFAMTGFRIGYACAPPAITEAMMKIHQYAIMCAPTASQEAAIEALNGDLTDVQKMKDHYHKRRDYIVSALNEMGLDCHMPRGAFYAFPSIKKTGLDAQTFSLRLLKEEKVAVVPGTAFGSHAHQYIRCSYATGLKQIEKAMQAMKRFVNRL